MFLKSNEYLSSIIKDTNSSVEYQTIKINII